MSTVTKMQMFEKIRTLREKSQSAILYMISKNCKGIPYFLGDKYSEYTINCWGKKAQIFPVANAVLGKLQREGLIKMKGMMSNRWYIYKISELLETITVEDFCTYARNHKFYKNNSGIIETMYKEQQISKEEYQHWVECFYNSYDKQRFTSFKKLQKKKKANFTLGQKIVFYDSDKYGRTYREGTILKMNSTRAIVQEISYKGGWVQRWNCTYNSMDNRYSNEPAKFISSEPIKLAV